MKYRLEIFISNQISMSRQYIFAITSFVVHLTPLPLPSLIPKYSGSRCRMMCALAILYQLFWANNIKIDSGYIHEFCVVNNCHIRRHKPARRKLDLFVVSAAATQRSLNIDTWWTCFCYVWLCTATHALNLMKLFKNVLHTGPQTQLR